MTKRSRELREKALKAVNATMFYPAWGKRASTP